MKTFEEVVDAQGRVLCGKGVEISETMLQKFHELGVSYITVEGAPVKLPWEKTLEEELELLEKRFSNVDDEFLLNVKEIIKEVLTMKYSTGAKNG